MPGITIDGTDPDDIAAAFAWARRSCARGPRPHADRSRGDADVRHAHHDDMLYLGKEPSCRGTTRRLAA
jgi:hypothetical protein